MKFPALPRTCSRAGAGLAWSLGQQNDLELAHRGAPPGDGVDWGSARRGVVDGRFVRSRIGKARRPLGGRLDDPAAPSACDRGNILERFHEANRGDRRAPVSTTGFYLSPSRRLGPDSIPLAGTAHVPKLRPGRKAAASTRLTVPANTPQAAYLLLGCANAGHQVKEGRSRKNCRVAKGSVTVTTGSSGGGSSSEAGCIRMREPTITSTDQHCFDGNA